MGTAGAGPTRTPALPLSVFSPACLQLKFTKMAAKGMQQERLFSGEEVEVSGTVWSKVG
jgi:hypothetical protein